MSYPGLNFLICKMGTQETSSCLPRWFPGQWQGSSSWCLWRGRGEVLGPSCVGVRL